MTDLLVVMATERALFEAWARINKPFFSLELRASEDGALVVEPDYASYQTRVLFSGWIARATMEVK